MPLPCALDLSVGVVCTYRTSYDPKSVHFVRLFSNFFSAPYFILSPRQKNKFFSAVSGPFS
jgi:hypothetical protein